MQGGQRMMGPNWRRRFKGHGYRITVPRSLIIDVLHKTNKHLSAEDVYSEYFIGFIFLSEERPTQIFL